MKEVTKYQNLQTVLPKLSPVLFESIQQDFLNIRELNLACSKYSMACKNHAELKQTKFVIYSPYINKRDRKYETFIFVDNVGDIVCHLSGQEMQLYGMIRPISQLHQSEEYIFNHTQAENNEINSHLKLTS